MLLRMKALVDGMRSFTFYVAHLFDRQTVAGDREEKNRCQGLIALLTPVIKAYCSERGFEICDQAIQVYGGYGYIKDYPVEQLLRDCKIASIYEGTNGIQAMDLLGRKLGMNQGRVFMALLDEIKSAVDRAARIAGLSQLAAEVERAAGRLAEVATGIGRRAMSAEIKTAFAFAHPFLRATGDIVLAWMHLWRAAVAQPKLAEMCASDEPAQILAMVATNREAAFYDGQLKTATYFINAMLPETFGLMDAIARGESAAVDIHESSFGG
jgi:alkylation response protein AidB-like acyl-CoA dehydrogenase